MHQSIIDYINKHITSNLEEEDIEIIKETFKPKKLRKHQFFLQEGEISKKVAFIVKGAMKQYSLNENGKENIIGLFVENWWIGDRESMSMNTPSPYFIDAVEATEILVVNKEDMDSKLIQLPFMNELARLLTERQAYHLMRRVHSANTFSAEKRLTDLEKNYPEFFQRFPQHIIASYLGMTKETFSRIRKKSMKK